MNVDDNLSVALRYLNVSKKCLDNVLCKLIATISQRLIHLYIFCLL